MKDSRIVYPLILRGSVFLFRRFRFQNGGTKAKYCVVMEDLDLDRSDVIVALTTSRLEILRNRWTVKIPDGTVEGLSGDSVLDLENYSQLEPEKFCLDQCVYIGQLPAKIMQQVDKALPYAARLPTDVVLRMRP